MKHDIGINCLRVCSVPPLSYCKMEAGGFGMVSPRFDLSGKDVCRGTGTHREYIDLSSLDSHGIDIIVQKQGEDINSFAATLIRDERQLGLDNTQSAWLAATI